MKKLLLAALSALLINGMVAQSQVSSKSQSFNIQKEIKPPILKIIESSVVFEDMNKNKMIDADENCKIKMQVSNSGLGEGMGLTCVISTKGTTQGLNFKNNQSVSSIKVGETKTVEIPISSNMNTADGSVDFYIKIEEPNGFGSDELHLNFKTKAFIAPMIKIVDYTVTSSASSGLLEKKQPFKLQILLQNTDYGIGENILVKFGYPTGVVVLSGNEEHSITQLTAGTKTEIVYDIIVSDNFSGENIPLQFTISEKHKKYAENKTINLQLKQRLAAQMITVDPIITETPTSIEIASLRSDVDNNIPANSTKYQNRYAIIIGNEDYTSHQSGLNSESNVPFAVADANSFREYCLNVLGVKDNNLFIVTNATASRMKQEIERVSKIISLNPTGAELIFFYAGHGQPDENKEPYIMPVDVTAQRLKDGIKLNDLYKSFSDLNIDRVTVFLDACFSGGGRDAGLLAARSVREKPNEGQLNGNIIVFAATEGDQVAMQYRDKQHGMFTYFLLKKLQETKGNLTYKEMSDYLRKNVSEYSLRVNNREQDPIVKFATQLSNKWENFKF